MILAAFGCAAFAAGATIAGTVKDASNNPVAGATVTVTNQATGAKQTVQTNAAGGFAFSAAYAGAYDLMVKAENFVPFQKTGITDSVSELDVQLETTPPENWNLYYQATSIGDYHGTFLAPYTGPLSLQDYVERDVSLTTTLFFAARLERNTQLVFNPEIAGGRGFSGVDGLANPTNGELPRVASAEPKPYLARLFVSRHDFAFGSGKEHVERRREIN